MRLCLHQYHLPSSVSISGCRFFEAVFSLTRTSVLDIIGQAKWNDPDLVSAAWTFFVINVGMKQFHDFPFCCAFQRTCDKGFTLYLLHNFIQILLFAAIGQYPIRTNAGKPFGQNMGKVTENKGIGRYCFQPFAVCCFSVAHPE